MKSINEYLAGMTRVDMSNPISTNTKDDSNIVPSWVEKAPNIDDGGVTTKYCHQLRPEQIKLTNNLKTGKDQYIIMGAGGGKTLPVVCYWMNEILELNVSLDRDLTDQQKQLVSNRMLNLFSNPNRFEKVVWMAPTKTLVNQTEEDMVDDITNILKQYIIKLFDGRIIQIDVPNEDEYNKIRRQFENISILSIPNTENIIMELLNLLNPNTSNNYINQYGRSEFVNRKNKLYEQFKIIVVEYVKFKAKSLVTAKTGDSGSWNKNAIMIISVFQSTPNIIKQIKNIRLVIGDEIHLAQNPSALNISDNQSEQISDSIYKTLEVLKKQKTQLILITATVHKIAAENFVVLLNKCFNRTFSEKINVSEGGNPSIIKVQSNDELLSMNNYPKILNKLISNRKIGNLFILYSNIMIERLAESMLLKLGVTPTSSQHKFQSRYKQNSPYKSNQTTLFTDEDFKEPVSNLAKQIENKFLRKCVNSGFGYIHGGKYDKGNTIYGELSLNDKKIIAKLFSAKKLYVVIATSSVGVGINIKAQNMYIPSNEMFDGKTMNKVPLRDTVQIVNRVGRGSFKFAYINTPSKHVEDMVNAINATNNDYPEVEAIGNKFLCNYKIFRSIWMKISGLHKNI